MKMKLDKDAVLGFLLQHVEKFVLAGVLVFSGMIVYGAVQRKTYDKVPDELSAKCEEAANHVRSTDPQEIQFEQAPMFLEDVTKTLQPIDRTAYRYRTPFTQPLEDKLLLREKPPVLAVEELRGSAGRAPFRVAQAGAAAPGAAAAVGPAVQGKRWIVVTGLVPIYRQREAYVDTFCKCEDPNPARDVPKYYYYWVERAKVKGPTDEPVWQRLPRLGRHGTEIAQLFGGGGHYVVPQKYRDPNGFLAMPLGPKTGGVPAAGPRRPGDRHEGMSAWANDPTIAHLPKIPVTAPELPEGPAPEPAGPDFVPPGGLPPGGLPPGGLPPVAPVGPARPPVAVPGLAAEVPAEFWLFRVFDFDVQPGESYRYRVQLVLENPNAKVRPRYLNPELAAKYAAIRAAAAQMKANGNEAGATAEMAKILYLKTKFSEPSEPIYVPEDYQLLLASVKPPLRPWQEPSAEMMVVKWVESHGKVAHHLETKIVRGNVLNFPNQPYPPGGDVAAAPVADNPEGMGILGPGAAAPVVGDSMRVNYMTDTLVLDMAGGGKYRRPGRVIVLDANGNLVVNNQLDDQPLLQERNAVAPPPVAQPKKKKPTQQAPPPQGLNDLAQ